MVSCKIKRSHTKRRTQTKRNSKKNAKSRKNRMIGGYVGRRMYLDKTYEGQIWPQVNKPHGNGTMTWNNGDVYHGQWKYGKMSGLGTMTWHNGVTYRGNWRNNKRNGFGVMRNISGKLAEGVWQDDIPIGKFKIIWPNADPILGSSKTVDADELDDLEFYDDVSEADTEPDPNLDF